MHELPLGRLGRKEAAEGRAILKRRLLPVALYRVPAFAQPLLVGVTVLRDDRGDSLRVARREAEAHRGTVIEDVDGKTGEPSHGRKPIDDLGQMIECVLELRPV